MKWIYWILFFVIIIFYLALRVGWQNTIEFGYDQPRLASTVLDFLRDGNFWSLQRYSIESPWGNLSWGGALVLFYAPFLKITTNPLNASLLIAIFNSLSVVFVFFIGKNYFSKRVGLFAALILAVHPWWIIFSRMIYQPTPIPTLVAVSIFFLFKTIEKPKSKWIGALLFSWAILLQMYLITFSFVAISGVVLLAKVWRQKISFISLGVGLVSSFIIYLPSLYYYTVNPAMFYKFFNVAGKFQTNFLDTLKNLLIVLSGGGFKWQLGYGYSEFIGSFPGIETLILYSSIIIVVVILLFFWKVIQERNVYLFSLLLFLFAPVWAIPMIGVGNIVPRYFLYILPAFSLIFAISIEGLISKTGRAIFLIFPLSLFIWWLVFVLKYFNFIQNYNYPNGFLSSFSDVPYSFLDKSFNWIVSDAKNKGYKEITISDNWSSPKVFSLNQAQRYYWEYLLGKKQIVGEGRVGHYLMYFSPAAKDAIYRQFGPYVVYEVPRN